MQFIQFLRKIKRKIYYHNPLIRVFIYKNNLLHNLHEYQSKFPNIKICPVLKSNAYGHGLVEVAKILDKEYIEFLVVDSIFEAKVLRNAGVKSKILIIGFVRTDEIIYASRFRNVSYTITSLDQLKNIAKYLKSKRNFHLKFDTGMHRQGILPAEKEIALEIVKNNKYINIEGICSHLADADAENFEFTNLQISRWNELVKYFKENLPEIKYYHLAATPGMRYLEKIDSNMVRLGYGLYGFNPKFQNLNLQPVLEMRATITSIRTVPPIEGIGYNITFKSNKPMQVATISAGYFEGVERRLSNKGFVKIKEKFCPIVGRVSMNITSIDISEIENIKIGDEVVIISSNAVDKNSAENNAKICETIPYEILVDIPQHLKREVV